MVTISFNSMPNQTIAEEQAKHPEFIIYDIISCRIELDSGESWEKAIIAHKQYKEEPELSSVELKHDLLVSLAKGIQSHRKLTNEDKQRIDQYIQGLEDELKAAPIAPLGAPKKTKRQ